MTAKCSVCGAEMVDKEVVLLACVPVEWDEGLGKQWLFACWNHTGVEQHADTEETERFHRAYQENYVVPEFKVIEGWSKGGSK